MQIGAGASPFTLAVLKTLGNQAGLGAPAGASPTPGAVAGAVSSGVSNALSTTDSSAQIAPAQDTPAGPPEPGKVFPRGSFVDLKA